MQFQYLPISVDDESYKHSPNPRGTQYRHGIYYHTEEQKELAEGIIKSYEGCKTECLPAVKFWDAEGKWWMESVLVGL